MALESTNPASGERIREYRENSAEEISQIILNQQKAFETWRESTFSERAAVLKEAARVLHADARHFAELMALEMGKPVSQGIAEIEKCAWTCDFFADKASSYLAPEEVQTEASRSRVVFEPLGILLAIMPWNFPFWQLFRCAAPALMAGNVVLLKHASNVSGCALAIEDIFRKAAAPAHLVRTVLLPSSKVNRLIEHPLVQAVTLTGSTEAGRAVAAAAGNVLKKTVLELGGSDPYIILEDADLERAVEICVKSRLINSGQSCVAAKRFIVVDEVAGRFEELMVEKMKRQIMQDPFAEGATIGPLARKDLRDTLHEQVQRSVELGARLLLGGEMLAGPGWFYPPTVLAQVTPAMPVFAQETFGPVAAIVTARDEDDAISKANSSDFGLGGAIFSRDVARAERLASEKLQAGCCFVNDLVRSDPRMPFGGVKQSGYGRELSHFGIREFVNIKTVWVR